MVIKLLGLIETHSQCCIALWEDEWKLTPMQKSEILDTFLAARLTILGPSLIFDQLLILPLFNTIRSHENFRGAAMRILLAVGNGAAAATLKATDPAVAQPMIEKCMKVLGPQLLKSTPTEEKVMMQVEVPKSSVMTTVTVYATVTQTVNSVVTLAPAPPPPPPKVIQVVQDAPPAKPPTFVEPIRHEAARYVVKCPGPGYRYLIDTMRTLQREISYLSSSEAFQSAVQHMTGLTRSLESVIMLLIK